MPDWFVYLVRCADGSLYCGITNNIEKRMTAHSMGRGARYIRAHGFVGIAYQEGPYTRSEALRREFALKKMRKLDKEQLVQDSTKTIALLNLE